VLRHRPFVPPSTTLAVGKEITVLLKGTIILTAWLRLTWLVRGARARTAVDLLVSENVERSSSWTALPGPLRPNVAQL
jgi:hypothetical protein